MYKGNDAFKIQFCGAASEVTGSMLHLTIQRTNKSTATILLDAGAFQGSNFFRKNVQWLPFNPKKLDYIFISHAHFDHIGRLPLLVKKGFNGKIIGSRATKEIGLNILEDSLGIQKEKGRKPYFNKKDLEKTRLLFQGVSNKSNSWEDPSGDIKVRFISSEHILGSHSIMFEKPISLLYTSDLGSGFSSLHSFPKPPSSCDYLIMEATYGNRINSKSQENILNELKKHVDSTMSKGGKLLIPVFSVGRTEEVLYLLKKLKVKEKVYLDTTMGINVLKIYEKEKRYLSKLRNIHESKNYFHPENFKQIFSNRHSEQVAVSNEPCIILSSSGMLEGGRILNHLPNVLSDQNNTILFSGFQAEGTRGRKILDGARKIGLADLTVSVNAKIDKLEGLSAHADRDALLDYFSSFKALPSRIFIVHGSETSCNSLKQAIQETYNLDIKIPRLNDYYINDSLGDMRQDCFMEE